MTKTPLTLSIALMLSLPLTFCGCQRDVNLTEQEHIQRAKDFDTKGNLKGSIIELKNVLEKNPNSPQARLLLGQIYLKAGMGAEAENELTKAEKLGVSHETIQIQLGEALMLMGEYQRVLDEIQAGSQTSTINLARIQQIRADALLNQGKLKEACGLYQQSLNTDASNPPTYWGLAKCSIIDGSAAKAKEWLVTALKLADQRADTWVYMGDLERRNNNAQAALAAYTHALELEPNNLKALERRTSTNLSLGQVDPARKDLDHLQKLAPKSLTSNYLQALLNFYQMKYPAARDALQEVFKTTDNHAPSLLLAGATEYALGAYEQAQSYLNRVLVRFPNNAYARRVLAATQIKQGQPGQALETLSPVLSANTTDIEILALAGEASLRTNDYDKAMYYLDRAATLDPQNAAVKIQRAAGYMAAGESGKALADLEQVSRASSKPGGADMALVMLYLQRHEYDGALKAIASLEAKLPDNPVTQSLRASALLGKRDRAGARAAWERALAIQPTFFPAAFNLARLDLQDNKPDDARKRFEAILKKDKNNTQAMVALANLAADQKQESDYVGWLEKAAKANPKAIAPQINLIQYYLGKNEQKKALLLASGMVNSNPDNIQALMVLAAAQLVTGDKDNAIASYEKAAVKAPNSPEIFFKLGQAQLTAKHVADARESFEKVLALDARHLQALDALIQMDVAEKKFDAALARVRQFQARFPNLPSGYDREGAILYGQRQFAQAARAYEQAITRGADTGSMIMLHRALIAGGDRPSAEQKLTGWIKSHPKDEAIRAYTAEFRMQAGQDAAAITLYEELLRQAPQSPVILNNLAMLYQRQNDKRALATAEQAYKVAPEQPIIQDTLGWILVEQGQPARGIELLRQAAAKAPKAGSVRYHYAVALARTGKQAQAKQELNALLQSKVEFPESKEARALLEKL